VGYLSKFENDLFMSYQRVANDLPDRWIDAFADGLRANLAELLGGSVTIWRDTGKIAASNVWRADLQAAVDKAGIFLAVMSHGYLSSKECARELDRFLQHMKQSGDPPRRLVPVFKQPLDPDTPAPDELARIQDHKFFDWPKDSRNWRELRPDDAGSREFWASLGRLAQDIMFALKQMEDAAPKGPAVFLARTPPELDQHRERIRGDLRLRGFEVVPRNEYLWSTAEHAELIQADLDDARLCIHLVSGQPSQEPASFGRSLEQLVLAHATMKAKGRPLPLVWIQPSEVVAPEAAELLRRIEGELANDGLEYWCGSLEDLKTQIHDKLAAAAPKPAGGAGGEIALLVEEADLEAIGPLRSLLVDSHGLDPKLIKFAGAAPKDVERMKRTLASCSRCIVFWSAQGSEWLEDVLSHPALAGHHGRSTLLVHMANPRTPDKSGFLTPKAGVIDATQGASDTGVAMDAFLGLGGR